VLVADGEDTGPVREAALGVAARDGLRLSSIREVMPSLDEIYRTALEARNLGGRREVAA
jgi:hypothetical protein